MAEIVAAALAHCKTALGKRTVRVDIPATLPAVQVDFDRVKDVLVRLIENADAYSPKNQPITISAEVHGKYLSTSVADNGPGIEEMELGLIFDKFYRGKDQRYLVLGTGMGLLIAKAIVEAHGGTISVNSQRVHASVNSLTHTLEETRTLDQTMSGPAMKSATILVVDDEPQIRRVLRATLSAKGYAIVEARDGQEALEKLRSERPDLVLLDVNMPIMDGLEACREIRRGSDVAIIMLTVRSSEQDKVRALDAGADDYVVKPFGIQELLARVRAVLRRGSNTESQNILASKELSFDFGKRTIIVRGTPIHLTPKEFEVLRELVANGGGADASHRRLLQAVWGPDYGDETESLRVVINWQAPAKKSNPIPRSRSLFKPSRG